MERYCKTKTCIDLIGTARCTGCSVCQTVCASMAINVKLDLYGFYRPIVDREICTKCSICQQYCPVIIAQKNALNAQVISEPKVFGAWTLDEQIRITSSSGGLFSELAKKIIENGGMVAGCVWGNNLTPEHILTDSWEDVVRMRGSKYVPSKTGEIYRKVMDVLHNSDKKVLFSGTPCQVAAMDAMLGKEERERVILVDFICHGVPSLRVFHLYLDELFNGEKVTSYTFRNKDIGWQTILAHSVNGDCYHVPASKDPFFRGFAVYHLYVMEACHSCLFAKIPRVGDITLGDFWGCPEHLYDKRGVSLILCNTLEGNAALECAKINGNIDLEQVTLPQGVARNSRIVQGEYVIPSERKELMKSLIAEKSFSYMQLSFYPSKMQLLWAELCQSKDKSKYFVKICGLIIRKLTKNTSLGKNKC